MKNLKKAKTKIKQLVKPLKGKEVPYAEVESYCESRNTCRSDNSTIGNDSDILF